MLQNRFKKSLDIKVITIFILVIGESTKNILGYHKKTNQITLGPDVTRKIAGQKSLLTINAAIEGTRSGNKDKGFSVAASDISDIVSQFRIPEYTSHSVSNVTRSEHDKLEVRT